MGWIPRDQKTAFRKSDRKKNNNKKKESLIDFMTWLVAKALHMKDDWDRFDTELHLWKDRQN